MATKTLYAIYYTRYYGNEGYDTTYSIARSELYSSGGGSVIYVGQRYFSSNYRIYRGYPHFHLRNISGTITSATLKLTGYSDNSTTDFDIQIREYTGSEPANDDATYNAYGNTSFGSINTSNYSSDNGGMEITFNEDGLTYLNNCVGDTCTLMLVSSRDMSETSPSGDEYIGVYTGKSTTLAQRPTLVITYTPDDQTKIYSEQYQRIHALNGDDATYSTSRTTYSSTETGDLIYVGQRYSTTYKVHRGYPNFDMSAINKKIKSATLKFIWQSNASTTDFDFQVRGYDESSVTEDNTGFTGYGSTSFGNINTSEFVGSTTVMSITLNDSGVSYLNSKRGGDCILSLVSSRDMNADTPSGNEYMTIYSSEEYYTDKVAYLEIIYEDLYPQVRFF